MRIAILSNGPANYSTSRLVEEAKKRGHEVEVIKYKNCYLSLDDKHPYVFYEGRKLEGYDAILCPVGHFYFSNATNNQLEGLDLIRSVYDIPVIPEGLNLEESRHILGAEACMWTERVADRDDLEWKLLPRLSTLAELQWSDPAAHDLDTYLPRLHHMAELYRSRGWNARELILPFPE